MNGATVSNLNLIRQEIDRICRFIFKINLKFSDFYQLYFEIQLAYKPNRWRPIHSINCIHLRYQKNSIPNGLLIQNSWNHLSNITDDYRNSRIQIQSLNTNEQYSQNTQTALNCWYWITLFHWQILISIFGFLFLLSQWYWIL